MEFMTGKKEKEVLDLATVFADGMEGREVKVNGAIMSVRNMGDIAFVILRKRDGVLLHGAVFIEQIGDKMKSGEKHDGRAPDYDDWKLNGDILVYYPVLDIGLELSSMGIRVDEDSLKEQLVKAGCEERAELPFQKAVLEGELPYTVGGGIGQSRICMFFLRKAHIGEVQASIWPDGVRAEAEAHNIHLL